MASALACGNHCTTITRVLRMQCAPW
jgi:hypothetical protein